MQVVVLIPSLWMVTLIAWSSHLLGILCMNVLLPITAPRCRFPSFFYLGFLSRIFMNHRTAGERGGHFFNSLLSLPSTSQTDISQVITAGYSPLHIATISFKIFCDFSMFYQIFLPPQVKRWAIIAYKHCMYELPHELSNDLRLRILGN